MKNKAKLFTIFGFLIFILGIYSSISNFENPKQFFKNSVASVKVAELVAESSQKFSLDKRTKFSNCQINAEFPDHACTPGAVFSDKTLEEICVSGYTKKVRNVSTKLRKQIYSAYNINYPPPTGSYELDHLIPLAIGGSNDIANLFPESKDPKPGFREKDIVEVYLREEVCSGRMDIKSAQIQIANDWLSIYQNMDKNDISRLRNKYKSWSDSN